MSNPYAAAPFPAEEVPSTEHGARRSIRGWSLGLKGSFAIALVATLVATGQYVHSLIVLRELVWLDLWTAVVHAVLALYWCAIVLALLGRPRGFAWALAAECVLQIVVVGACLLHSAAGLGTPGEALTLWNVVVVTLCACLVGYLLFSGALWPANRAPGVRRSTRADLPSRPEPRGEAPRFPLHVTWHEDGEREVYEDEANVIGNLEIFDGEDPEDRASATIVDALGRPVHVRVDIRSGRLELRLIGGGERDGTG